MRMWRKFRFQWLKYFSLLTVAFAVVSCATYQSKISHSRELLKIGQFEEALPELEKLAADPGKDQLVYLLDYATALQVSGRYQESANAFNKADKLVDLNDYHSVTNVVQATLGGEESIQYKGESYEKFLINTLNAINYVILNQLDDALVEARRINEKISKMQMDGRSPYEQSPFARYLAGVLWEAQGKYDDAYIEYEASYDLDGTNPLLPNDLLRMSQKSRRNEAFLKWKKEFPNIKPASPNDKSNGEVVFIIQQGWGPEKHTRHSYRFPELYAVRSQTTSVSIQISGFEKERSENIYSIERVAIDTLEKDFGALVGRRVGGIVAKAVVADQIRQKNQLLGELSWIAMNVIDRADLRQWSSLPQTIQMKKFNLKPGKYTAHLQGLDASGNPTAESKDVEFTIQNQKTNFINWRTLN